MSTKVERLTELIKVDFPDLEFKFKDDKKSLGKVIGVIFFVAGLFNKRFYTDFTTVLFGKIYFPNKEFLSDDDRIFSILAHEYMHLLDKKKFGMFFTVSYLFPQILAVLSVLSVLAIFNPIFLLFITFLGFLAPLPSLPRKIWEIRGYNITMAVSKQVEKEISQYLKDSIVKNMVGWEYYKISWDEKGTKKIVEDSAKYIETGENKTVFNPTQETILSIISQSTTP